MSCTGDEFMTISVDFIRPWSVVLHPTFESYVIQPHLSSFHLATHGNLIATQMHVVTMQHGTVNHIPSFIHPF